MFMIWGPAYERSLVRWCLRAGDGLLAAELLPVIQPSLWADDGVAEVSELQRMASDGIGIGASQVETVEYLNLPVIAVDPLRLFATLVYARMKNGISWISVNRVGYHKTNSLQAASTLALMIASSAILPAGAWRDRHRTGPALDDFVNAMAAHLSWHGTLTWRDKPMRALLDAAGTCRRSGWLTRNFLADVLALQKG
jgi:hypothetical protein